MVPKTGDELSDECSDASSADVVVGVAAIDVELQVSALEQDALG